MTLHSRLIRSNILPWQGGCASALFDLGICCKTTVECNFPSSGSARSEEIKLSVYWIAVPPSGLWWRGGLAEEYGSLAEQTKDIPPVTRHICNTRLPPLFMG